MKMTIQKCSEFTIDTGKERKRINKAFKRNKTIQKKLLKLMDLIEGEKWQAAEEFLDSKWWAGRDKEMECPRLEFVGLLNGEGDVDHWDSYIQLVWKMNNHSGIYTVMETK